MVARNVTASRERRVNLISAVADATRRAPALYPALKRRAKVNRRSAAAWRARFI
jgi:hypothetical protein